MQFNSIQFNSIQFFIHTIQDICCLKLSIIILKSKCTVSKRETFLKIEKKTSWNAHLLIRLRRTRAITLNKFSNNYHGEQGFALLAHSLVVSACRKKEKQEI